MTHETQIASSSRPAAWHESARDYRWVIGPWIVVLAFTLVTLAMSRHVGIPIRDPGGSLFGLRLGLSLVLFGLFVVVDAGIRAGRSGRTWRNAVFELRRRWPKDRVAIALTGLLAYHIVYVCYRNLKSWVAFQQVRDTELLDFDRWLFFGNSPAILLHDLLGDPVSTYVLALVYRSFAILVPVSFVAALVFANRIRDGYVFLMSAIWLWIFGLGSYYLIPSRGPFASAPEQFAHLSHTAITATQGKYLAGRSHLLQHPLASDALNSISAFASLHVAFTFMVLLVVRSYGFRRATIALGVYLIAVIVATIYFGWHYTSDDLAGLVVGFLAALFGRWIVYPRRQP